MKYSFNYGNDVITLPKSAAAQLAGADRESLAVLISLAADKSTSAKKRAAALGISVQALERAVGYWTALGVISPVADADNALPANTVSTNDTEAAQSAESGKGMGNADNAHTDNNAGTAVNAGTIVNAGTDRKAVAKRSSKTGSAPQSTVAAPLPLENSVPHLTIPELTDHAGTEKTAWLLEYCQQKMGRMLNSAEAERIVGICDYLGVSCDFVALLCGNLKKEDRLTPRALENLAIELHDRGITDYDALIEYMDHREQARSFEGKVRKLFGLGSRTLTPTEKKMLERWAAVGTSADMIDFAYELTVSTTGNASLKYANAIIEAWAADGVKSSEEAKKREEDFRQRTSKKSPERKKKASEQTISSFETDDFFEKALRRSFGDDFYDNVWNGEEVPAGAELHSGAKPHSAGAPRSAEAPHPGEEVRSDKPRNPGGGNKK